MGNNNQALGVTFVKVRYELITIENVIRLDKIEIIFKE